jgi:hypothetical protein
MYSMLENLYKDSPLTHLVTSCVAADQIRLRDNRTDQHNFNQYKCFILAKVSGLSKTPLFVHTVFILFLCSRSAIECLYIVPKPPLPSILLPS